MTRFARARGSKSSNERLPEAATSWDVMKQQLKDKLEASDSHANSTKTSQKIWKPSDFDRDIWNKNEVKWADLEASECAGKAVKSGKEHDKPEKKKKKKHTKTIANEHFPQSAGNNQERRKKDDIDSTEFHDAQNTGIKLAMSDENMPQACNAVKIKKTKKKKKEAIDGVSDTNDIQFEKQTVIGTNKTKDKVSSTNKQKINRLQRADLVTCHMTEDANCGGNGTASEFSTKNSTKKKLGKKRKRIYDGISDLEDKQLTKKYRSEPREKARFNLQKNVVSEGRDHQLKKKHKNSKKENTVDDDGCLNSAKQNFPGDDAETLPGVDADVSSEKQRKKKKDNKCNKAVEGVNTNFNGGGRIHTTSDFMQKEGREKKKYVWQQENNKKFTKKDKFSLENRKIKKGKSEKNYLHTTVLHMNGKDIEIVKFDGFPVRKEDAENLIQLKKKMIANGIPASEIKATMKLERRKAEKALAREKKKVCFHCRKSGHVLSECPELGKADTDDLIGTGICFKCGSTEHKHFECRVTREQEFRYAKCFICNEQGHIARQCPDNPRGLYPKGGACHICGDVTHLKKDCPDLIKEKEEKIIKLQTLSNKPLEALDDDRNTKSVTPNHVSKKRTVKF